METWSRIPQASKEGQPLIFQALTWTKYDYNDQFHITCCGCDESGNSVALTICDFTPSFFVRIPERLTSRWNVDKTERFTNWLRKRLGGRGDHLLDVIPVRAKILYPFTNEALFPFLKLKFSSLAAFKSAGWAFKKAVPGNPDIAGKYEPYETNIDPMVRFTHIKNLNLAGWINLNSGEYHDTKLYSRCSINVIASYKKVNPILDKQATAPFVLGSFDIECDSKATRDRNVAKYDRHASREDKQKLATIFPDATKPGDEIRIICTSLWKYGTKEYFKHAVCVAPCNAEDTEADVCECARDERDLLIKWFAMLRQLDPDVLMGWNIYGFDDEYIYKRLQKHGLEHLMEGSGRLTEIEGEMVDGKLVTSAYGTNFFRIMNIPGVYKVDLYVWFKRETKLESYKLDNVSAKFLGDKKVDLLPLDLFYKMNIDGETMAECVRYCVQDTMLPLRLTEARMIFINLIGMANITRTPIEWLITRGQQIKVFSQITYETRLANVLVPSWDKKESDEKFVGATVLHANKGAYFEAVSGLDFASLYPSIMIAFNLCYSTMILPEDLDRVKQIPGLELENIKWQQKDDNSDEMIEQSYWYVQNIQGILPRILDKLWKQRKSVKKLMKKACKDGDHTLEGIYNAEQLAIKVSMNSVYGFTGATNGFLPMKPIASSVTARGRQLIEMTKNHCEKTYECSVVYGDTDSCYVKFVARDASGNILKPEDPGYMQEIFRLSEHAAQSCNVNLYKKPVELEFEKVMYPFFLFTKKRYAYLEWLQPDKSDHLDAKGIHLVRRDVCPYVQETSVAVLNKMFYDRDVRGALEIGQKAVGDLVSNIVPVEKLKLSKTLKVGYKCSKCHTEENENGICACPGGQPTINLPHVQLAKRMRAQNAVDPPVPGERVPYVFIQGVGLQHERVEHPDLLTPERPYDGLYYLEHQLQVPLETLFELVLTEEAGYSHGTATLFEKGPYGEIIQGCKEHSKLMESRYKDRQRKDAAKTFRPGMNVRRKIKANEFMNGVVKEVDEENARVTVELSNGKTACIFPDSLSRA